MSIFNVNPDPDYPVMDGPGFIQHTCQPFGCNGSAQQQFYYNGQTIQPAPMPQQSCGFNQPQFDSRRYDAQPTAMPQSTPTYGFNQLVETTRRNQGAPTQTPQPSNPWGVQNQQPAMIPAPQQESYYPAAYDPKYSALYTGHPKIDSKQSVWGNQEVYSPIMPPTVNWGSQAPVVPQYVPQYGYMNSQPIQYPQAMQQPIQQNWEEIAKHNFVK